MTALGQSFGLVKGETKKFKLSVTEAYRGEGAWARIKKANQFNDPPQEGMEYLLVRISVDYLEGPQDEALQMDGFDFRAVSKGQILDVPSVVKPKPEFDISYFPGASGGGWAAYEVFADDPDPTLVIGLDYRGTGGFYFATHEAIPQTSQAMQEAQTAVVIPTETPAKKPTATPKPSATPMPKPTNTPIAPIPSQTSMPVGPGSTVGDGTHIVGSDIAPGRYRARSLRGLCYWERLSGFSGEFKDIIANDTATGSSTVVDISLTDKGFSSSGCGKWTLDLAPVTVNTTAPFADGTYIVGVDIAPGTWRSSGGDICYWERLSGFSGEFKDIIANDTESGQATVTIAPSDVGFSTSGCGEWTLLQ
jgi:hypothetical protein